MVSVVFSLPISLLLLLLITTCAGELWNKVYFGIIKFESALRLQTVGVLLVSTHHLKHSETDVTLYTLYHLTPFRVHMVSWEHFLVSVCFSDASMTDVFPIRHSQRINNNNDNNNNTFYL